MKHVIRPRLLTVVFLLMALAGSAPAKRVMLMPFPLSSHGIMYMALARALMDRGHEVWVVLPSEIVTRGYLDLSKVHVIEYNSSISFQDDIVTPFFLKPYLEGKQNEDETYVPIMLRLNEEIQTNQSLFKEMKDAKPDLFVFDDDIFQRVRVIFSYRMGVPFACICYNHDPLYRRIPFSPAIEPVEFSPVEPHVTFMDRVSNVLSYLFVYMGHPLCPENAVELYAPDMPYIPMTELSAKAEVYLYLFEHILDYPRPSLPNVKFIGGLAASPGKPLPPYLQEFMNSAQEGVVVVSFGSIVLELPETVTNKLLSAFEQVPMKVVFRSNITSPDPSRILVMPWIPQNDLLAHPNTKVLVTHCGTSSQYQALYHAVPMLGFPLFFDQSYSAERMRGKGFGLSLDLRTAQVSEIVDALITLSTSPAYKQTLRQASSLFREQFGVPAERGAYWLDHVMQHGGKYMRYAGQEIPLYQFLLLDVLLFAGAVFLVCTCLMFAGLWCFWRNLSRRKPKAD